MQAARHQESGSLNRKGWVRNERAYGWKRRSRQTPWNVQAVLSIPCSVRTGSAGLDDRQAPVMACAWAGRFGAMGVERVQAGGIEVKNCKRYCKQCDSGSITGLTTVTPTDTSIRAAGQRHGQGQTDRQAGQGGMGYRHRSERKYCIGKGLTPPSGFRRFILRRMYDNFYVANIFTSQTI